MDMVAVREVVRDRLEQPRTLGVRSAEGGETGDGHTSALLQLLLTSYYCVVPVSCSVLHLEETLKDARHDLLFPATPL